MTTTVTAASPPEQNSSRTATQQSTSRTMRHNRASTERLPPTTETVSATYTTTIDGSNTTRQRLSSIGLSKTTERKLTERQKLTSTKPANSNAEAKTTENTRGVHTSGDVEPLSRVILGIPLKYIIIAGGSFVVLIFAFLLLVCHLCKRRYVNQSVSYIAMCLSKPVHIAH